MVTRSRCRSGRGQDLVEYALVMPLVLLMIVAIVEFAVLVYRYSALTNAAREGARAGVVPQVTEAHIREVVKSHALGLDLLDTDIAISHPTLETVRVQVHFRSQLLTGAILDVFGGSNVVTLRAAATMRTE